jgi:hypothetical protein
VPSYCEYEDYIIRIFQYPLGSFLSISSADNHQLVDLRQSYFLNLLLHLCLLWQFIFLAQYLQQDVFIPCVINEFHSPILIRIFFLFPNQEFLTFVLDFIWIQHCTAGCVRFQLNQHDVSGYTYRVNAPCFLLILDSTKNLSSAWSQYLRSFGYRTRIELWSK